MVRLKVIIRKPANPSANVSIPYGSIKSENGLQFTEVVCTFQFLMVRLKDPALFVLHSCGLFQFLMVRLKVQKKSATERDVEVSIPYGSIKRAVHNYLPPTDLCFNSLWFD